MVDRVLGMLTVVSFFVLIVLLNTTTPTEAGPFGVLALFIAAYIVCLGLTTAFLFYGTRVVSRVAVMFAVRKPILPLSRKRSYYYSTVIALGPIILLGLQSVGTITVYEFFLVSLFIVFGCVYVAKRT